MPARNMFLHSGASLHGHEYSSTPQLAHQSRNLLLRSAFAPPKQRARDGAIAPVLRQRPASDHIPRDPSPVHLVRFREPQDDPPPTPSTHDGSISESELSDGTVSTDAAVATRSSQRRRVPRVQRKSTTYFLGYPTPRIIGKTKVMQKVFLPRLLLQLQKVSEDGRSRPVLEVFPASRIAGPVVAPRLSKRFPGIFGVKRHLGYDDIVLVRRDDSDLASDGTEGEHEDSLERRNILAVYSPLKHSNTAEIVLDDGSVWVAKPLANGSYDFVHTDLEGNTTTARWARRNTAAATPTSLSTDTSTPTAPQTRYTFSIINPLTRRHAVLATLTPSNLNVQDTYTSVSSSHNCHPPVTRIGRSHSVTSAPNPDCYSENDSAIGMPSSPEPDQRTVHQIDEPTKMLIGVTALWVALRAYTPSGNDSPTSSPAATNSPNSNGPTRVNRSRRNTWTRASTCDARFSSDLSSSSSSATPGPTPGGVRHRYSMPAQSQQQQQHHTSFFDCRERSRTSTSVPTSPVVSRTSTPVSAMSMACATDVKPLSLPAPPPPSLLPRRVTSTGASFMKQRLATSSSFTPSAVAALVPERDIIGGVGGVGEVEAGMGRKPTMGSVPVHLQGQTQALALVKSGEVAGVVLNGVREERERGGGLKRMPEENGKAAVKKGGVRSRLSRWISKLGSGSR